MKKGIYKTVGIIIAAFFVCMFSVLIIFSALLHQYRQNIAYSSASHLIEINRQGKVNLESYLNKDKNVALAIANEIETGAIEGEDRLYSYIDFCKSTWNEDDVYIYTEDGVCVNREGVPQNIGTASAFAAEIVQKKTIFRIVKSRTEYAVAVNSDMKIRNSHIVAISVVHNLDTIIDDMGLRSFDGLGTIYLTRNNGVRICHSNTASAKNVYNLLSVFEPGKLTNLKKTDTSLQTVMSSGEEGAFLFASGNKDPQYIVLTPVDFMNETLFLFNIVPRETVNQMMNSYTRDVIILSGAVILLTFLLIAFFLFIYRRKVRSFDSDIRSRERLFDLLVGETKNAFILLKEGAASPVYASSNLSAVFQNNIRSLERSGKGYRLICDAENGSSTLYGINADLEKWDGKHEYISDYIPYVFNSEPGYLRISLYPVVSQTNEFVGVVQDMTSEYNHEKDLREALTLADSANRAKTQFLSSVSHDIRTPLNAIINMSRFLQQSIPGNVKAEEQVKVIQQSSAHLLSLINDVLDMSRIESGKVSFVNEPFDMKKTLNDIYEIIRPLCEAKEQTFQFSIHLEHNFLRGDELRLNQILINILNNAVKFTPENGSVSFGVTELPVIKETEIPFRFVIRDTGIGIREDKLKTIFEPFSRIEDENVRSTEGTGLGLAITKRFIDALGGTVSVESVLKKGSVFTVELTYAADSSLMQSKETETDGSAKFSNARALLVEDNEINKEIASTILSDWGISVESSVNGKEAFELFSSKPYGYYDIIYMDIQMPIMNGYDATREIRALGNKYSENIPIIAMTANAFAEDVERARAAGMSAHVSKPIEPKELHKITEKFLK